MVVLKVMASVICYCGNVQNIMYKLHKILYIYIYIFMLKRNFIEEDDSTNIILEFSLSRLLLLLKMSKTVFFWVARIRK